MSQRNKNGGDRFFLTPLQAAQECGVTRRTVYNWLKSGRLKLEAHEKGSVWLIPARQVKEILDGR